MDIRTFAVFPDKKFKYGGIVYIGSPDIGLKQLKDFVLKDSFANYAKNKKIRKCLDSANFITNTKTADNKTIYMVAYRFYPPFLWGKKRIIKAVKESFDNCVIMDL